MPILEQYGYMESLVQGCWMCLPPSFSNQRRETSCVGCCVRNVQCGAQPLRESVAVFITKQNIRHTLQLEKRIHFVTGDSRPSNTVKIEDNLSAPELGLALDRLLHDIMDRMDHLVYQHATDMPPRTPFRRASWSCPPTLDTYSLYGTT